MLTAVTAPELFDRTLWFGASDERRAELVRTVGALIGDEFRFLDFVRYAGTDQPIAVFLHESTGAALSLVPGGGFDMGLSPEEERTIRAARAQTRDEPDPDEQEFDEEFDLLLSELGQMRPLHRVVVPPFLISQRVVRVGQVQSFIENFRDPLYGHVPAAAAHLSPEQITALLVGAGMRLPAEAELEYAARGGLDRCLLPTGDRIPDENTIEAMIADTDGATHNAFGLHGYGLYPELCADAWHEHYKGAPDDGSIWSGVGMRVVRGGAADCYPWQGCGEWNMLLCAYRMNDRAAEFGAAIRMVKPIADLDELDASESDEAPAPTASETKTAKKKPSKKAPAKAGAKKAGEAAPAKAGAKKSGKATSTEKPTRETASEKTGSKKASKTAPAKAGAKKAGKAKTTKKTAKATATKKAPKAKPTTEKTRTKPAKQSTAKAPANKTANKKAASKTPPAKKTYRSG